MDVAAARKAMLIGKTVHFLRACCADNTTVLTDAARRAAEPCMLGPGPTQMEAAPRLAYCTWCNEGGALLCLQTLRMRGGLGWGGRWRGCRRCRRGRSSTCCRGGSCSATISRPSAPTSSSPTAHSPAASCTSSGMWCHGAPCGRWSHNR
jgi:hypothetical protein